jgi:hypothetical protein
VRNLRAKLVPVILIPEEEVAYQILALNTEKAHHLKEKSLEVIRMYRGLTEKVPRDTEEDYAFQFESATSSRWDSSTKRTGDSPAAPLPRCCAASTSSSRFLAQGARGTSAPGGARPGSE